MTPTKRDVGHFSLLQPAERARGEGIGERGGGSAKSPQSPLLAPVKQASERREHEREGVYVQEREGDNCSLELKPTFPTTYSQVLQQFWHPSTLLL